jgi:serine/threonine-protein kinase
MSPEQAAGRTQEVGPAADVYALGVVLYELLIGRPPFEGTTALEVLKQVVATEPVPPRRCRPELPRDLEAVCLKCLEKDPARRYDSAEALADDLRRWLQGDLTRARPASWLRRCGRVVRRHPRLSAAVGLALVVSLAAVLASYYRNPERQIEAIERDLAHGRPVVLVGDEGRPRWWSWQTDANLGSTPQVAGDPSFTVQCLGIGLVELVRDPHCARYRVRAEVRHVASTIAEDGVGIYVGHQTLPLPQGVLHFFCHVSYDDVKTPAQVRAEIVADRPDLDKILPPAPKRNPVYLQTRLYGEGIPGPEVNHRAAGCRPELFEPRGIDGGDWRRLSIVVTPSSVSAQWDAAVPIGELSTATVSASAQQTWNEIRRRRPDDIPNGISPTFAPRGGLGLFVSRGTASFRRVVVEPLGDEP